MNALGQRLVDNCYYVNPNCNKEAVYAINEFHVDMWVDGYQACSEHIDYLLDYIKNNGNYAKVIPMGPPLTQLDLFNG